eukprot:TRINITY_DN4566_c0_g1_i2.p1 TRINITY_DN4566_c0_g1~~TRINITY_DN4566_c0_g1_i2.p1  ORF type:complete len:359 (-),score=65.28 TRINITY_DN4566_c0_g1_i2:17-1093(-)
MDSSKRKEPEGEVNPSPNEGALVLKKQKTGSEITLAATEGKSKALATTITRTSNLMAPIMLLQGHKADVLSLKFSPSGKALASGSFDKMIYLWKVYDECENYMVLKGHSSAVLEVKWSTSEEMVFSASADKTLGIFDATTAQRIKKCRGHSLYVNSIAPARRGPQLIVSGSDDGTVKLWDVRVKGCVESFQSGAPVTSVEISDHADQIFSGGLDDVVKVWDIRKKTLSYTMEGHTDTITGISLSPDGSHLLSNGMDNTVRMWDVRPYASGNRMVKIFQGAQHGFEKNLLKCSWSQDGSKISAGSADRFVYVWEVSSRRILYKLPGHRGSVNQVDFHPNEPIIGSASSDGTIYLGEIKP